MSTSYPPPSPSARVPPDPAGELDRHLANLDPMLLAGVALFGITALTRKRWLFALAAIFALDDHHPRAFSEHEAVAPAIEGARAVLGGDLDDVLRPLA